MTRADAAIEATKETAVFLVYIEDLRDYRQKGEVAYPQDEVLLVMLAASLAGKDRVANMARFGQAKLGFCGGFDLRSSRALA